MLIVAGLFSANFCSWRGRAFVLAVQAALESRKRRIALTNLATETPDPFCAAAPARAPAPAPAPASAAGPVLEDSRALTAGINQMFAGTSGSRDGGGRPVPVAGVAGASTRAAASINATTSASGLDEGMGAPASALRAPVSSTTPITQCASLVRELLQPSTEVVSSIVLPRGAGSAGAVNHDGEENVSLMRGATGFSLDGTGGGTQGGNSRSTPSYGSTIASRSGEPERASNDSGGHVERRGEPNREPQHNEEHTESRAHGFLHGPSRLMHKISGRDSHQHADHSDNEDMTRAPESPDRSGGARRFLRGPSHLMHKIASEHHHRGGKESTPPDDPERLGSAKGSPESPDSSGHSHKWHRPHWHHKKHYSK